MPRLHGSAMLIWLVGMVMLNAAVAQQTKTTQIYAGTLGKQSISMEIKPGDSGGIEGRYFYNKYRLDLSLYGELKGQDHLLLQEGDSPEDEAHPKLNLIRQSDGGMTGTWQGVDSKVLPIVLQPVKPANLAANADESLMHLRNKDLYEYLRLSGLALEQGKRDTFMGHALKWWVQPDSKVTLFDVLDGYPEAQRKQLNRVLRDRLWGEVSSYYECMSQAQNPGGGNYDQTVTPDLMTDHVISINIVTSYFCGGAHPDGGNSPVNLDVRTAKTLTLEDVLWVGQGKAVHYAADEDSQAKDFDAYSRYRETYFAPWLIKQLKALYPRRFETGNECDYSNVQFWQFPTWYLTPEGLTFTPNYPHVMAGCADDDWKVPYSVVKKYPGVVSVVLP